MLYNVNTTRIKKQLNYLQTCYKVLTNIHPLEFDLIQEFAAARAIHMAVECMIDVGTIIIDGFLMRDPSSYLDIADILGEEQVISLQTAMQLKRWIQVRKELVQNYDQTDGRVIFSFHEQTQLLPVFTEQINDYLKRYIV